MTRLRWLLALPAFFLATSGPATAAEVRDKAGLFSAEAVKRAESDLQRLEREFGVPVRVETLKTLNGEDIDNTLKEHARAVDATGIYVLIARDERKTEVGESQGYAKYFPRTRTKAIREAFNAEFAKGHFDDGLNKGVEKIETTLAEAKAEAGGSLKPTSPPVRRAGQAPAPPARVPVGARPAGNNSWGIGSLLTIVIAILGVFLVIRIIGGLLSAGRGGYANQNRMGGPGYGPGGPGYGAPGYGGGGGGGGGFMSSMFGGIGGALAGNWLYDQFSGRHHDTGSVNQSTYDPGVGAADPAANNDFVTPGDGGGDWGGSGGDAGGGDWGGGGGDAGGGDWGGGGGGGGDWGGGGGGGDDGGSW